MLGGWTAFSPAPIPPRSPRPSHSLAPGIGPALPGTRPRPGGGTAFSHSGGGRTTTDHLLLLSCVPAPFLDLVRQMCATEYIRLTLSLCIVLFREQTARILNFICSCVDIMVYSQNNFYFIRQLFMMDSCLHRYLEKNSGKGLSSRKNIKESILP